MCIEFLFIHITGQLVLCPVHVGSDDVGLCSDVIRDHRLVNTLLRVYQAHVHPLYIQVKNKHGTIMDLT